MCKNKEQSKSELGTTGQWYSCCIPLLWNFSFTTPSGRKYNMKATFKLKANPCFQTGLGDPQVNEFEQVGGGGPQVKKFEQVWVQCWGWGSKVNKYGPWAQWGSHVTYHMCPPRTMWTGRTECGHPGEMVLTQGFVTDGIHCCGWFSVPNARSVVPRLSYLWCTSLMYTSRI